MKYVSFNKMHEIIKKNLDKIPDDIDLIVAIPRSGLIPATYISLMKNIPMCNVETLINNRLYEYGNTKNTNDFISNANDAKHILLVDDSSYSGNSLKEAKEKIPKHLIRKCTSLVTIVNENTKNMCDIYFEEINSARIFEWNLFHHKYLNYAAIDINTIYKNGKFIIKPSQNIEAIIIDNNFNKDDINEKLQLNKIYFNKIIYKYEIYNDIKFIITNNSKEYVNLPISVIDIGN